MNRFRARRLLLSALAAGASVIGLASATTLHASGAALPGPFLVDHPAGIAFNGSNLDVAVGSTGSVDEHSASAPTHTLLSGLVPGAFDRGPTGVAVDGSGNVYVGETEDNAIYFATPGGQTGVYARGVGTPSGLAFDSSGNLFIADSAGNQIREVAPDHSVREFISLGGRPTGIAFGPDGALYVSREADGGVTRIVNGTSEFPYATLPAGSNVPSAEGLAFDTAGDLFVGDGASGTVYEVPPGGGTPTAVAANFPGPIHLAFASDGSASLYVASAAEGAGSNTNRVNTLSVTHGGLPLAAPSLSPSPLPNAPAHGVAFRAGGNSIDPSAMLDQLPLGYASDVGHQAGEPKIEVTNAGDVYFNAAGFNGSTCNPQGVGGFPATSLRESKDGGNTWVDATPPVTPPCSLDPYEYYDRTTNRFFDGDLSGQCTSIEYTDNESSASRSWTNAEACGPAALDDHETLAAGPPAPGQTLMNGYPHAMYYCFQDVATARCDSSVDGGMTWVPTTGIPYNNMGTCGQIASQQNGEQTGHVVVGPDGAVYLPKANCLPGPVIAVSKDGGATWTQVLVHAETQAPDHEAAVAVDAAGTVYYDWISGNDLLPYLAISHDDGSTWSAPIPLKLPGMTEADQPDLIAGDAGKIAAYFMGTESDCCYGRTQDGSANQTGANGDANATQPSMWNNYAVISTNADSPGRTFLATTLNDPRHPTTRGGCGPGRCSATFDFLGTYIDNGGRLWGSISNACIAACSNVGLTGSNVSDAGEGYGGQLVCGPKLIGTGDLTPPAFVGTSAELCGSMLGTATPESPGAATLLLLIPGFAVLGALVRRRRAGNARVD